MPLPVQVTFRHLAASPAVADHVERRAQKLETFFDRIHKCHVVVETQHRHQTKGKKYHCRIELHVPGKTLVVSKTPQASKEDIHAAIDDAFSDAERVLETYAQSLEPEVRVRARPPHGVVSKVFHDRGYGFVRASEDGREVYFHAHSVVDCPFESVTAGMKVRYAEEDGDKGPQASSVYVLREAPGSPP